MEGKRALGHTQMVAGRSLEHRPWRREAPSGDEGPVARLRGFGKRYGRTTAVEGASLDIPRGEVFGLIGPDGSGKSSLMKVLAGVLSFEQGEVEVLGVKLDSDAAAESIKSKLGFMPQGLGLNLYPDLSVDENVDFFGRLRLVAQSDLTSRKRRFLDMTRLEPFRERPMKKLSGGMKQKLGLVCTLIHQPDLLILDEPTTGVDPVSRRDFWGILSTLVAETGTSVIASTAYMDEASRFHRMALMYRGRILATGSPDEIRCLAPGSQVLVWAKAQRMALEKLKASFEQVETLGPAVCAYADGLVPDAAADEVRRLLQDVELDRIDAGEPEMEDVFIALLRLHGEARAADGVGLSVAASPRAGLGAAIEARSLTRDFGRFRAVDGATFHVAEGQIFGLLGANGAGKTTLIKMLTGLLRPTEGSGHVAGEDMRTAGMRIKERIGYMSQSFSLCLKTTHDHQRPWI